MAVCVLPTAGYGQHFIDASEKLRSDREFFTAPPRGGASVDFNADGWPDVYFPGRLYMNTPSGIFQEQVERTLIEDVAGETPWVMWADYDNDGLLDMYAMRDASPGFLLHNRGHGLFVDANEAGTPGRFENNYPPLTAVEKATWGDFNNDGLLDLFLATGPNMILTNLDGKEFVESNAVGISNIGFGLPCTLAPMDYDRDLDLDLFIGSCDGEFGELSNLLLQNNGDDTFTDIAPVAGLASRALTRSSLWFDYDNDGWPDLFVINRPGSYALYRNDTQGGFIDVTAQAGVFGPSISLFSFGLGAGDFDNDGWIDLMVSSLHEESSTLYHNNGDGTFTDIYLQTALPYGAISHLAMADYNVDGWLDLAIGFDDDDRLYLNAGGSNHWVKVDLRGQVSTSYGVGARIELVADGQTQTRWITTGDGLVTQNNDFVAHFGLGEATLIESLEVYWPSGTVDRLTNVSVDQHLTIVEGMGRNDRPAPFFLTYPADQGIVSVEAPEVTFRWEAPHDSEGDPLTYTFYMAGEERIEEVDEVRTGLTVPEVTISTASFVPNRRYTWSVVASDGNRVRGSRTWSKFVFGEPVVSDMVPIFYSVTGVRSGSADLGDYDSDGDLDLLVTGLGRGFQGEDRFYTVVYALEDSTYTRQIGTDLERQDMFKVYRDQRDPLHLITPVTEGDARWGDYDNDGDLDFILSGLTNESGRDEAITRLYQNTGGVFDPDNRTVFPGVYSSTTDWGDYDGDGDVDLVMAGATQMDQPYVPITRIYRNDGNGQFVDLELGLPGIYIGKVQWGDMDGDGDLDLALMGESDQGLILRVYENNGGDLFIDQQVTPPGLAYGSLDWGDLEGDGDLDLLVTGGQPDPNMFVGVTAIYVNEGHGFFTVLPEPFPGVLFGDAQWGDYDLDGDADIFLTGVDAILGTYHGAIHRNYEGHRFIEDVPLTGLRYSTVVVGDYNGDGDLDLLLFGEDERNTPIQQFLLNRIIPELLPPGFE